MRAVSKVDGIFSNLHELGKWLKGKVGEAKSVRVIRSEMDTNWKKKTRLTQRDTEKICGKGYETTGMNLGPSAADGQHLCSLVAEISTFSRRTFDGALCHM